MGPDARSAIDAIVAAPSDTRVEVKISACEALAGIGPEARSAVPQLAKALADEAEIIPTAPTYLHDVGPSVRGSAAAAIGSMGPDAAFATSALIDALRSDNSLARRQIYTRALSAIGPAAIRPLLRAVRDPQVRLRVGAVEALARMGDEIATALPELVMELGNEAEYNGAETLRTIADDVSDILLELGDSAIPELRKAATDFEVGTGGAHMRGRDPFETSTQEAGTALPPLIDALKDVRLQKIASGALAKLGSRARTRCRLWRPSQRPQAAFNSWPRRALPR